uniref:uncharacterized protein LOC131131264 isoform X2 n=1 Tax=Doryrhamphus excisus TaxID=161450 RepID=UPI0025AD9E7F|nr:uncharacterized protein LOC131131264 isoform X2 [Doryrhamphus excisus]
MSSLKSNMEEKRSAKTNSKGSCDDDVDNTFQQQGDKRAIPTSQSPLLEPTFIWEHGQATEGSSLTKEAAVIDTTDEKHQHQTVSNPIGDSQLERKDSEHGKDQEGNVKEGRGPMPSQTAVDQYHVFPPTSVDASGSGAAALEGQQTTESMCHLERKQKRRPAIVTEAATAGEPSKKKRRMGMCGAMVKEASHFSHIKNGQEEEERPTSISTAPVVITQPTGEDVLTSSQHSTSDSETACKPSYVDDKDRDQQQDPPPVPDQTDPPKEENQHLDHPKPREVDCRPPSVTCGVADVQCVAVATSEKSDETAGDPPADACQSCALAPSGASEMNDTCGTGLEDTPLAVQAEDTQTNNTADLLASGGLDIVSDTQLNAIALIEEQATREDEDDEDATQLMCGLIRELSFLNRTIMAAHREIDNMRRARKNSRSVPR